MRQTSLQKPKGLVIRQLSLDDLDSLYSIYDSWGPVQGVEPLSPNRDENGEKLESYSHFMYGFMVLDFGLWWIRKAAE